MFNLFRFCQKDEISFDIVAKTGKIVAKMARLSKQHSTLSKGQNFTINSFDIVAVFGNKVKYFALTKSNVAGTLLLVWTGLNGT